MAELLKVINLSKKFPISSGFFRRTSGWIQAVHDVSFTLNEGEVLGIVGESGSGKSTLAKTILHLTKPTSGDVLFYGSSLADLSTREMRKMRKRMQIVFQNPSLSLNPRKTVGEVIGEVLAFHEIVKTKEEKYEKIAELLKKVGLDAHFMRRYPHELSIGQQQRVSIARALSVEPKLLVLDECVSALDVSIQAQVLNLLLELLESMNMSYLFISHDLAVVEHIADSVLVMYEGQVVEQGLVEDVFSKPQHPYTRLLLDATLPEEPVRRGN